MKRKLTQAIRNMLDESIDSAIQRKQQLRVDAEDRLQRIQSDEHVAPADLIALFRALLDLGEAQDSIAADRWSLLKF